jgi:hypothetical protein
MNTKRHTNPSGAADYSVETLARQETIADAEDRVEDLRTALSTAVDNYQTAEAVARDLRQAEDDLEAARCDESPINLDAKTEARLQRRSRQSYDQLNDFMATIAKARTAARSIDRVSCHRVATGRQSRPSTNGRARGSRRTTTTSGGARSDHPDPDLPRPSAVPNDHSCPNSDTGRSTPNDSLTAPRHCLGCGEAIDPDRRWDAVYCDDSCGKAYKRSGKAAKPLPSVEERLARLKTIPLKGWGPQPSGETIGGCDAKAHPAPVSVIQRSVRDLPATDDKAKAAARISKWLALCFWDQETATLRAGPAAGG